MPSEKVPATPAVRKRAPRKSAPREIDPTLPASSNPNAARA
jgi:hypothetical protein